MQTSRLISTISYNSQSYLFGRLLALKEQGIIDFAFWIWHKPEEDEKKEHAHLILRPSKRIDTNALEKMFIEPCEGELSRKVLPFRISKTMRDFILYSSHDKAYLVEKGESRKYEYTLEDWQSTNSDYLLEEWNEAHRGQDAKLHQYFRMLDEGLSFEEILRMGFIPANCYYMYRDIYMNLYTNGKTERNGRKGHED